jgi:4-hydroxy-2-oxoheptanedioate aldolase
MREKRIKERLMAGEALVGTWCLFPSGHTINALSRSGLDFLMIDMEHGPVSYESLQDMLIAVEYPCEALVRVNANSGQDVQHALDGGASGVLVPMVQTHEEAKAAVRLSKYPPQGGRGFSPFTRAWDYAGRGNDTAGVDSKLLSGVMVEGEGAIKNLDSILKDPLLDFVYVGTYDLSVSLGASGQVESPKVLSALKSAVSKITSAGKIAGCMSGSVEGLRQMHEMGCSLLFYKTDTALLCDSVSSMRERVLK